MWTFDLACIITDQKNILLDLGHNIVMTDYIENPADNCQLYSVTTNSIL